MRVLQLLDLCQAWTGLVGEVRPHPLDTARELLVLVDHVLDRLDGQVHHLLGAHAWGKDGQVLYMMSETEHPRGKCFTSSPILGLKKNLGSNTPPSSGGGSKQLSLRWVETRRCIPNRSRP